VLPAHQDGEHQAILELPAGMIPMGIPVGLDQATIMMITIAMIIRLTMTAIATSIDIF
jgi:hypothetical protein